MLWTLLFILLGDILGVEAIKRLGKRMKRYGKSTMGVFLIFLALATLFAVGMFL